MGEQLVWRSIQDNQWEGIYPGGKPLYCIHDQNMLLRRANGQCCYVIKPTAIGVHIKKIAHSYLELFIALRNKYFFETRFVSRNIRILKQPYPEVSL